MKKVWLIAGVTYRQRVRSGAFLFLTFALPILMVIVGAVAAWQARGEPVFGTIGLVDSSGVLSPVSAVETEDGRLNFQPFENAVQAEAALAGGEIDGYLVVPSGYLEGEQVVYHGPQEPGLRLTSLVEDFLRRSLAPVSGSSQPEPPDLLARLENPSNLIYVSQESGEELSSGLGLVAYLGAPAILAVMFALAVTFSTAEMGAAVIKEKEQRAMEMVITSLRPEELVSGKVLGMAALAATQFGVWLLGGVLAVLLLAGGGQELGALRLPWVKIAWGIGLMVPGYLTFAMLGAGLGITAGDTQQAKQLAGLLGWLGLLPIWILPAWMGQPEGPLAVALTLFPLTAPSVTLLRMVAYQVPTWQLIASLVLLLSSLVLVTLAVTRVFRAAMLLYGQRFDPRQIWQALRQA